MWTILHAWAFRNWGEHPTWTQRKRLQCWVFQKEKLCSACLGPAAFTNHDCRPKCEFLSVGQDTASAKALRDTEPGEEILATMEVGFLGGNNEFCECYTCERWQLVLLNPEWDSCFCCCYQQQMWTQRNSKPLNRLKKLGDSSKNSVSLSVLTLTQTPLRNRNNARSSYVWKKPFHGVSFSVMTLSGPTRRQRTTWHLTGTHVFHAWPVC